MQVRANPFNGQRFISYLVVAFTILGEFKVSSQDPFIVFVMIPVMIAISKIITIFK